MRISLKHFLKIINSIEEYY